MPHLSHSQIETFLGCPQRWKFSRTDREPGSAATLLGTVVHHVLEVAMRDVADGRPLPDAEQLVEVFIANFEMKRHEDRLRWYGAAPAHVSLRGEQLLRAIYPFLEHIQPYGPEAIEQHFSAPLDASGWTLDGVMDLVTANSVVVDWKTAGQPWEDGREHTALQVSAYYVGHEALYGKPPAAMTFVVLSQSPRALTIEPVVQVLQTTRTPAQIAWYRRLAANVARAIESEAIYPNPAYQWCGPRNCHWWEPCMETTP